MFELIPSITLWNGCKMPQLGLGTGTPAKFPGEVTSAVQHAISLGYRLIDTASVYGTEVEVGNGVAASIKAGLVGREDLFIVTKVWNNCHKRLSAVESIRQSLKRLGTPYVDLVLVHWPMGYKEGEDVMPKDESGDILQSDVDYLETWQGLEECVHAGLVKSIGFSNFNAKQMKRVMNNAKIKPAVLQAEYHPHLEQRPLMEFCRRHHLAFTSYAPLGSAEGSACLLSDPQLLHMARGYRKSPAQILLRFHIDSELSVVCKSYNHRRLEENINIFDFNLAPADISTLVSLNRNCRYFAFDWDEQHPHYPF